MIQVNDKIMEMTPPTKLSQGTNGLPPFNANEVSKISISFFKK
jgi:hypothetical protein